MLEKLTETRTSEDQFCETCVMGIMERKKLPQNVNKKVLEILDRVQFRYSLGKERFLITFIHERAQGTFPISAAAKKSETLYRFVKIKCKRENLHGRKMK